MEVSVTGSLLLVLLSVLIWLAFKLKTHYEYWESRAVPGPKPLLLFGNCLPVVLARRSFGQIVENIYKMFPNEPVVGLFNYVKPTLLLKEPKYYEQVLIKDFSYFADRLERTPTGNPFTSNLFTLKGSNWKAVRTRVSPTFTSGRIKSMFPQVTECAENLVKYIDQTNDQQMEFNMKKLTSSYALDVIASCAFGFDPKKLGDPDSEFRKMAREFFNFDLKRALAFAIQFANPKLSAWLNLTVVPTKVGSYFSKIVNEAMAYRKENNIHRDDFVNLLVELKEKRQVGVTNWDADDDYLQMTDKTPVETVEMTDEIIMSQAIIFLTAGFESTANTIACAVYEMTRHPDTMVKAREEVNRVLAKNKGSLTYEALKDMQYVENCVKETLRLHPIAPNIFRVCLKKYTFDTGLEIEPGTNIIISANAIHKDPQYFPDPEIFNPDRFIDFNSNNFTYMPFGMGPRICIAMRFALLEVKIGLATLLHNYDFKLSPNTDRPLKMNPRAFLNILQSEINCKIIKLKS